MKLFAITHQNRDGCRVLTFANQSRNHYNTRDKAEKALEQLKVNGLPRIREILGETGFATLEVREIECYENGDAKGIYVECQLLNGDIDVSST